jgi:hypothetical protein
MEFTSSPLGMLYTKLQGEYQNQCPQSKRLDECELRADSNKYGDLRVKTGDRSGWSKKKRKAHQTHAIVIVGKQFSASINSLISEKKSLDYSVQTEIRRAAGKDWDKRVKEKITLGDLKTLHRRAIQIFNLNLPETPKTGTPSNRATVRPSPLHPVAGSPASPSASASALSSSSLSSSLASPLHWTVVPSSSLSSSLSSSAPSSSSASASPVASSTSPSAAALTALKALYPVEKFPADHGENDAASPAKRRAIFHAKLDVLVEIAAGCAPTLLNPAAERGGYRVLRTAAQSMKVEPHLEPAVALYKQTVGPTHDRIAAVYKSQVDDYVNSSDYRK